MDEQAESRIGQARRREMALMRNHDLMRQLPDRQLEQFTTAAAQMLPDPSAKNQTSAEASTSSMDRESQGIGWAVKQMHNGSAVTRRGWNGKGMFLRLQFRDHGSKMTQPYIYMLTADQQRVPWTCSQSDLIATDWEIFITE